MWQLIVFEEIVKYFAGGDGSDENTAYAQDPVFNEVDTAFLSNRGISVLEDPTAFASIDSTYFVFAPHFPVAAWPSQMRLGCAGLVVSNDVERSLDV